MCIHRVNEQTNLGKICDLFSVSPRWLDRNFKKYIGVSPKYYYRIVRFNQLLTVLYPENQKINWISLVNDFGYFDQAHLIKEFKYFTGMAPDQYRELLDRYRTISA